MFTGKKMHVDLYIRPFIKVNQKWIKNFSAKHETLKPQTFSKKTQRKISLNIDVDGDFFLMTPKA